MRPAPPAITLEFVRPLLILLPKPRLTLCSLLGPNLLLYAASPYLFLNLSFAAILALRLRCAAVAALICCGDFGFGAVFFLLPLTSLINLPISLAIFHGRKMRPINQSPPIPPTSFKAPIRRLSSENASRIILTDAVPIFQAVFNHPPIIGTVTLRNFSFSGLDNQSSTKNVNAFSAIQMNGSIKESNHPLLFFCVLFNDLSSFTPFTTSFSSAVSLDLSRPKFAVLCCRLRRSILSWCIPVRIFPRSSTTVPRRLTDVVRPAIGSTRGLPCTVVGKNDLTFSAAIKVIDVVRLLASV